MSDPKLKSIRYRLGHGLNRDGDNAFHVSEFRNGFIISSDITNRKVGPVSEGEKNVLLGGTDFRIPEDYSEDQQFRLCITTLWGGTTFRYTQPGILQFIPDVIKPVLPNSFPDPIIPHGIVQCTSNITKKLGKGWNVEGNPGYIDPIMRTVLSKHYPEHYPSWIWGLDQGHEVKPVYINMEEEDMKKKKELTQDQLRLLRHKKMKAGKEKLLAPKSGVYMPIYNIWEYEQLFAELCLHANFFCKIAPVVLEIEENDPYTIFHICKMNGELATGMAICSTLESYNRKTGIELSIKNAIKAFNAKMDLEPVRCTIDEFDKEFTIAQAERVCKAPYRFHCNYVK